MSDQPIRLLIADDHALFRDGMAALLAATADITRTWLCHGQHKTGCHGCIDSVTALLQDNQRDARGLMMTGCNHPLTAFGRVHALSFENGFGGVAVAAEHQYPENAKDNCEKTR